MFAAAISLRAEPATFAGRVAPIFDQHCAICHGPKKQNSDLRLDSHEAIMRGAKSGAVVTPGDAASSEIIRRVTLPEYDDDVMPSDGKPHLSAGDIAVLEKWIAAGAPLAAEFDAPPPEPAIVAPPAAPDYGPRLAVAQELAETLGVRLVPRSRLPTDGLVLRTASAPARCDDGALAKLAPLADLIVDAELARTNVTDAGLAAVGTWKNLRQLDLARTSVTAAGVAKLAALGKLESLNLTGTKVDGAGIALARSWPALKKVWAFDSPAEPAAR